MRPVGLVFRHLVRRNKTADGGKAQKMLKDLNFSKKALARDPRSEGGRTLGVLALILSALRTQTPCRGFPSPFEGSLSTKQLPARMMPARSLSSMLGTDSSQVAEGDRLHGQPIERCW